MNDGYLLGAIGMPAYSMEEETIDGVVEPHLRPIRVPLGIQENAVQIQLKKKSRGSWENV